MVSAVLVGVLCAAGCPDWVGEWAWVGGAAPSTEGAVGMNSDVSPTLQPGPGALWSWEKSRHVGGQPAWKFYTHTHARARGPPYQ